MTYLSSFLLSLLIFSSCSSGKNPETEKDKLYRDYYHHPQSTPKDR